MIAGLLGALLNLVGGLAIYIGVPLGGDGATPSVEESFATAAVGAVLAAVVALPASVLASGFIADDADPDRCPYCDRDLD